MSDKGPRDKGPPEKRPADKGPLSKRVRRFARVGTGVGGVAMQLAGARALGLTLDEKKHARALKDVLGGLKGPLMKAAQILATIPDALPPDYAAELRELQSQAPPMGWPFVRRRLQGELGAQWQDHFRSFSKEAAAAASLGQVHKAEDHDGRELAVKLQYPDMQAAVEADLAQLRLAFSIYRRYDPAIDTSNIFAELSARLREELDYEREAANMALYRAMLADEPAVHIPEVVGALSTKRLLTMTWLAGLPLPDFLATNPPLSLRNAVAMTLFRAWYVPFYRFGVIHGDPHLGNYAVRPDGEVSLLDFGCIRVFRPSFVEGVIALYHALLTDNEDLARQAYQAWGFEKISKDLLSVLNRWARFLYGPVLEDKTQPLGAVASTAEGARIASDIHRELRSLGGVKPPREFVLMDRAAIGLGSVFLHLQAEVNWHQVFRSLVQDFDVKALGKRQEAYLKAAGVPSSED